MIPNHINITKQNVFAFVGAPIGHIEIVKAGEEQHIEQPLGVAFLLVNASPSDPVRKWSFTPWMLAADLMQEEQN